MRVTRDADNAATLKDYYDNDIQSPGIIKFSLDSKSVINSSFFNFINVPDDLRDMFREATRSYSCFFVSSVDGITSERSVGDSEVSIHLS